MIIFLWIHKILTMYWPFFYGSIKFWWNKCQNFMDPQKTKLTTDMFLWIHKFVITPQTPVSAFPRRLKLCCISWHHGTSMRKSSILVALKNIKLWLKLVWFLSQTHFLFALPFKWWDAYDFSNQFTVFFPIQFNWGDVHVTAVKMQLRWKWWWNELSSGWIAHNKAKQKAKAKVYGYTDHEQWQFLFSVSLNVWYHFHKSVSKPATAA